MEQSEKFLRKIRKRIKENAKWISKEKEKMAFGRSHGFFTTMDWFL
jgi:translation elongation factor EF-1beta